MSSSIPGVWTATTLPLHPIPHKAQQHLVRILDRYVALYGPEVRLHLGGLRLGPQVALHYDVSFRNLATCYRCAHIYVSMSEKEGFGVPLLEAQYHRLPIVALDICAALRVLHGSEDFRAALGAIGNQNYERYSAAAIRERFYTLLAQVD